MEKNPICALDQTLNSFGVPAGETCHRMRCCLVIRWSGFCLSQSLYPLRLVCLFLKRGADYNAKDKNQKDPITIAVDNANADIVTL